ncbi:DUF559 domain-containing protein [Asticcacaulis sp. ZE23SCel15]|uniref:endonuclease domain-containing protein n=1 Tax=Asticcacaulis sp. ZE23SCel15 TaxID=3059027 RepID=UPI00265FAC3C|nr:DUF559 domain-containing protein [Asticcacaulis sp. ZE23SCel15]WKL57208.1 DUF559 domain-containing protein [Asticcacaulis sp. ZE23SCel15]
MLKPTRDKARALRKDMSLPEMLIWGRIRVRQKGLPQFRRQHPLGIYVADFYCAQAKLVIEIDGMAHRANDRVRKDDIRDSWMTDQGLMTLRISAVDVLKDPDEVADGIYRLATERLKST